jgi:hypothetical protein
MNVKKINELRLTVVGSERTFDVQGELALHPEVSSMYVRKGYQDRPKTKEEAQDVGVKAFNGLQTSFSTIYIQNGIVWATIAPTRYLIGQAMRDLWKTDRYSAEDAWKMSPHMAGVSLIVPVKIGGEYFLLSQIKGAALGSGQIHAGVVAGGISKKSLDNENPLIYTLVNECSEELGIDLGYLNPSSFAFFVDESPTGQVNFAAVAKKADFNDILSTWEKATTKSLVADTDPEVMGLSALPVEGVAIIPLEKGVNGVEQVECFFPTQHGLEKARETRGLRPYTEYVLEFLGEKENLDHLMQKAGI